MQSKRRVGALHCNSLRKEPNALNYHRASTVANAGTETSVAIHEARVQYLISKRI